MTASKLALMVLTLAVGSSLAGAQTVAASFDELRKVVVPGTTVTVVDTSGGEVTGSIAEVSTTALVLMVGAERRAFQESDVRTVLQRRQDSVLNGALWGAAAGGILGALGASSCANDFGCSGSTGEFLALGCGVGAGVGIAIDALIRGQHPIYEGGRSSLTMRVVPMLGEKRGALVSLAFR
jgi:hypothetical protein